MPLHVSIRVNDDHLHDLVIGRTENFKGADKEHAYIVMRDEDTSTIQTFKHLYSDGPLVCVERALQALGST